MKKSVQFIILTCAVSWVIAGVAILLGLRPAYGSAIFTAVGTAYMLLPAICAIILQIIHKEKPFRNLNVSFKLNRWFLVAWILPIIYIFMALGINLLLPGVSFSATSEGFLASLPAEQAELAARQLSQFSPIVYLLMQVGGALIAGCTINAVFGFGEELGWRGYLLKALQTKKMLTASLIIGVVWGLWHFPFTLVGHNFPQHPVAGVWLLTISTVLITPIMIYIVIKSKSVVAAAILHGTNNGIAGIALLYSVGGNDITRGIAGSIALLFINALFYLYDKYITKENIYTKVIGEY
jgi:membrane protease YdiL (CAAX protease family)